MQVDTRNRDCGIAPEDTVTGGDKCPSKDPETGEWQYWPGPEPKQARWPGNKIPWSGGGRVKPAPSSALAECPCTDRFGGDPLVYGPQT